MLHCQAVAEGLASVSSSVERSTTIRKSIIQSVDASLRFRVVEKMNRGGPGQQLRFVDDGSEPCSTAAENWGADDEFVNEGTRVASAAFSLEQGSK